ncbi:Uncharacterised protein [Mycobacterium tuberculosis]|nr:Uncharacterised protein [Mycobacterium tuberculosis]COZ38559.1 Uncharacterised protein [Mycobacterium tuberculosis]
MAQLAVGPALRDARPSRSPSVSSSANSLRWSCFPVPSTAVSMNKLCTAPTRRRRPCKRRPPCNRPAMRALRWTARSSGRADDWTMRWSSHAANTTQLRPARRPGSPAFPAEGPKHERRTSFSPTRSVSWTTRWRLVITKHLPWTPKWHTTSRLLPRCARPWSRMRVVVWARAGSP